MPYSPVDDSFLRSHGFINLYPTYRMRLLKIAKDTHATVPLRQPATLRFSFA